MSAQLLTPFPTEGDTGPWTATPEPRLEAPE